MSPEVRHNIFNCLFISEFQSCDSLSVLFSVNDKEEEYYFVSVVVMGKDLNFSLLLSDIKIVCLILSIIMYQQIIIVFPDTSRNIYVIYRRPLQNIYQILLTSKNE